MESTYQDKTSLMHKSVDQATTIDTTQKDSLKAKYAGYKLNIKVKILETIKKDFQSKITLLSLNQAKREWQMSPEYQWLKEHRTIFNGEKATRSLDAFERLFKDQTNFITDQIRLKLQEDKAEQSPPSEPRFE